MRRKNKSTEMHVLLSQMTVGHCPNTYIVLVESGEHGSEWKHQKKKTHRYCSPTTCKVPSVPHPNTSVSLFLPYKWGDWGSARLNLSLKVTRGGVFPPAPSCWLSDFSVRNRPLPLSVLVCPGLGTWLRHRRSMCFIPWTPRLGEGPAWNSGQSCYSQFKSSLELLENESSLHAGGWADLSTSGWHGSQSRAWDRVLTGQFQALEAAKPEANAASGLGRHTDS